MTKPQPFGQTSAKLWNRNFSLVAACNAIALLGNMTLSFALAYYVRDITGSEAMFGLALSAPYISLLLMTPIGGIMADRLKKQRIMFWIDVSVVGMILVYMLMEGLFPAALSVAFVKLLALNAIQGMYMSATAAAVPLVVPSEKLQSANAAFGMINSLITAAGQALAAVLYGNFGIFPILIIFAVVYGITAIMDLFIRVPFFKQKAESNLYQMIKNDMSQALKFAVREKPIFIKLSVIFFVFAASVISLLLIGTPILVTETLGMDLSLVGISQVFMAIGGLLGGITAGTLGKNLTIRKAPLFMALASLLPVPIGLSILLGAPAAASFVILTAACALIMSVMTMFTVTVVTFLQKETPPELLGKILSILTILPFLAQATGQLTLGVLFERLPQTPWAVVFMAAGASGLAAVYSIGVTSKT